MSATTQQTTFCRTCGAPVMWLLHVRTNKPAPIDARPNPDGNIVLEGERCYRVTSEKEPGVTRYTNHFQTCPSANVWKK